MIPQAHVVAIRSARFALARSGIQLDFSSRLPRFCRSMEIAKSREESLARVDEPLESAGETQIQPPEEFQPEAPFAVVAVVPHHFVPGERDADPAEGLRRPLQRCVKRIYSRCGKARRARSCYGATMSEAERAAQL